MWFKKKDNDATRMDRLRKQVVERIYEQIPERFANNLGASENSTRRFVNREKARCDSKIKVAKKVIDAAKSLKKSYKEFEEICRDYREKRLEIINSGKPNQEHLIAKLVKTKAGELGVNEVMIKRAIKAYHDAYAQFEPPYNYKTIFD